jgi:nicotinate-nucleotide adenylyltransferase
VAVAVGLYGGAFDPPHLGHVEVARRAKEHFELDRLVVLVSAQPGHKAVHAPLEARLELARAAFPADEVRVDEHERTVDLLRTGEWTEPLFVVGADQFCDFLDWKEPEAVLELARLGVATRPGFPQERLERVLTRLSRPDRVELFPIDPYDLASRDIRARAAAGDPLDGLVPPAVASLIQEGGLYHPPAWATLRSTSPEEAD